MPTLPTLPQDSLVPLGDSVSMLTLDSVSRTDSLLAADSIALVQYSLRTIIQIPQGFEGTPLPSVPQTENWVFILLLSLFFLFVFTLMHSLSSIAETISTFFQVKERSSIFSKATVHDARTKAMLVPFSVGVYSLYAYYAFYVPANGFSMLAFIKLVGVTVAYWLLKYLIIELMGYVFVDIKSRKMARDAYFNLVFMLAIALFPLLVFHIYSPSNMHYITSLMSIGVCVVAELIVLIKLFQIFFQKIIASFYILLYLCTLEILPLLALYQAYKFLLSGVSLINP